MKYWTQRKGGQRASAVTPITFEPNFAGQGGFEWMCFLDQKGFYHYIVPETEEDVKELMRQAHVLHHQFKRVGTLHEKTRELGLDRRGGNTSPRNGTSNQGEPD